MDDPVLLGIGLCFLGVLGFVVLLLHLLRGPSDDDW